MNVEIEKATQFWFQGKNESSNGSDIAWKMACSLRTREFFRISIREALFPDAVRMNRAWSLFFAADSTNAQLDGITEARRTEGKILSNSQSLDKDQQRWNRNLHYSCQISKRRLNFLSRNYSSSGFVRERVVDDGIPSDSKNVGGYAQLENKLYTEDKTMINFLIQYRRDHGDCHVPTGNTKNAQEEREKMGVSSHVADWVVKQRKLYRQSSNKKKEISASLLTKFMMLESIGFMWSCREAKWQRYFNKLEKLYMSQKEGNLIKIKEKDDPLYMWIEQQRKTFRKRKMPMERENLLREINFVFDPNDTQWWENYRKLCRYYKEQGNTMVPLLEDDENPNYLGQWVARQRRLYHSDSLKDDRINALNNLDFSWDPEAESWEKHYNQLCDFHRQYNHTRVPKSMGSLWNWVDRQRRSYRKRLRLRDSHESGETSEREVSRGTLITKEHVQKLSTIGFEWEDTPPKGDSEYRMEKLMNVTFELSIHDENWAKHYDKLCSFHKKSNHFSIPTGSGEYKELNTWVRHTRYLYNSNRLPQNRVDLLDSIGFAWTAEDAKWDRLCEEFFTFHKEYGHSDVPRKNTELYRWTKQQKENNECLDHSKLVGTKAKIERKKRLRTLNEIFL